VAYILSMKCQNTDEMIERCDSGLDKGRQLFQKFHSFAPPRIIRASCSRVMPRVLVNLGELRGLIYRSDKGQCGRPRTFIHFMETPPRLACDPSGKQLYIVGGNYRVTPRGIEG
jgi:hypothetical protein